jgi:hypothetical protein
VEKDGVSIQGIGFNMAETFRNLQEKNVLDIVFTLDMNYYRGEAALQLRVLDFDSAGNRRDQLEPVPNN